MRCTCQLISVDPKHCPQHGWMFRDPVPDTPQVAAIRARYHKHREIVLDTDSLTGRHARSLRELKLLARDKQLIERETQTLFAPLAEPSA